MYFPEDVAVLLNLLGVIVASDGELGDILQEILGQRDRLAAPTDAWVGTGESITTEGIQQRQNLPKICRC